MAMWGAPGSQWPNASISQSSSWSADLALDRPSDTATITYYGWEMWGSVGICAKPSIYSTIPGETAEGVCLTILKCVYYSGPNLRCMPCELDSRSHCLIAHDRNVLPLVVVLVVVVVVATNGRGLIILTHLCIL